MKPCRPAVTVKVAEMQFSIAEGILVTHIVDILIVHGLSTICTVSFCEHSAWALFYHFYLCITT